MIEISSIKEFNKYVLKEHKILIVYFYTTKDWCQELNNKLFSIFKENCNGNIIILNVNVDTITNIHLETNLTTVPIIRLYKDSKMLHEIYCTFPNLEEIITSLIS